MMRGETKIIKGLNCWRTRSIYYGMAISSSLVCLTITLVQIWSLPPWEDKAPWVFLAAIFLYYPIMVLRSLCVPVPTITNETRRMGEDTWSYITAYFMFFMFLQSHELHSVRFGTYVFGSFMGSMAVKQLNWPVRDVYVQHVVFTFVLACMSGFLGYQRPVWPAFCVFMALATLSFIVNHILDKALIPSTDVVHSPSRFRDLDV